jgi:hypothetical protein
MRALRLLCLAALIVIPALPAPAADAQEFQRFFPGRRYLPRLAAAPREPVTAAKLVVPFETPSRFGTILEGEVDLGASVPLVVLAGSSLDNAVVLGVEGGVFAKFNLETVERDLITSDWMFMLPVVFHRKGHWLQVRYFHTSAHLGDEYAERFNVERIAYARDALETTAYFRPVGTLGLYAGARWSFRVDPPEHKRWAVRGGLEYEDPSVRTFRAYVATDLELDQQYGWDPRLNLQVGARVYTPNERSTMRIALEFLTGPSPQGQFGGEHTTEVKLGVILDL